ncbi:hypothetical protein BCR35DRAFT_331055 [Leucosporidium creatinivorum]|uniref:RNA-dependent RNA polymerase n=1 Tax=Leucosporidium creatinivorum TaxID=106004 RepID=A0A1Y2FJG8_9BASI|nr:hypothetical protein BCR35DRAFT_331055 [Leucosporidium creatinivorum]
MTAPSTKVANIATRHLILSDMLGSSSHRDCKKLAKLHSDAVDFAKSGVYVPFDALPKLPLERKHDRPNFLRESGYSSSEILGQIYRAFEEEDEGPPVDDPVAAAAPTSPLRAPLPKPSSIKPISASQTASYPPNLLHTSSNTSPPSSLTSAPSFDASSSSFRPAESSAKRNFT